MTRKGRVTGNRWFARLALLAIPTPFLAASFGWVFTEMGRQPWVVAPNPTGIDEIRLLTVRGVSTAVGAGEVLTSMIAFTLLYAALGVVWYRLIVRYAREGAPELTETPPTDDDESEPLSFAY